MALSPGSPEEPAEPPFSEQARSAALAETMRLRAAGEELGRSTAGRRTAGRGADCEFADKPGPGPPGAGPGRPGIPLRRRRSVAAPSAAPSDCPVCRCLRPAAPLPASAAALATELAASASQRLADAAVADGGMARLLAAVGTAQLLQASSLAAAAGAPAPAVPDPAAALPAVRRAAPAHRPVVRGVGRRPPRRLLRRARTPAPLPCPERWRRPCGPSWKPCTATRWP